MRAILTYHSIDDSGSVVSIGPQVFRQQIAALQARGVRFLPLPVVASDAEDATDCVAVTFDDGFQNLETEVWPVLREAAIPATVFVATEHVGGLNDWPDAGGLRIPTLPLLGWDRLGRLAEAGLEIGSHTRTHADLRGIDAARLEDEIGGAADRIERELGQRPQSFAYPFGSYDEPCVAAVRRSHRLACTTELRPVRAGEDPYRLPRVDAFYLKNADRLAGFGTAAFDRYIAVRSSLRRARRLIMGE